jgi:hypothetical protein
LGLKWPGFGFLFEFRLFLLFFSITFEVTLGLTGLIWFGSSHFSRDLAPRCRLRFLGFGRFYRWKSAHFFDCRRELGLERCKSVWSVPYFLGFWGFFCTQGLDGW